MQISEAHTFVPTLLTSAPGSWLLAIQSVAPNTRALFIFSIPVRPAANTIEADSRTTTTTTTTTTTSEPASKMLIESGLKPSTTNTPTTTNTTSIGIVSSSATCQNKIIDMDMDMEMSMQLQLPLAHLSGQSAKPELTSLGAGADPIGALQAHRFTPYSHHQHPPLSQEPEMANLSMNQLHTVNHHCGYSSSAQANAFAHQEEAAYSEPHFLESDFPRSSASTIIQRSPIGPQNVPAHSMELLEAPDFRDTKHHFSYAHDYAESPAYVECAPGAHFGHALYPSGSECALPESVMRVNALSSSPPTGPQHKQSAAPAGSGAQLERLSTSCALGQALDQASQRALSLSLSSQQRGRQEGRTSQEPELKVCEWSGCEHTFLDLKEFVKHLEEKHVNQEPKEKNRYFCLWANCKRNKQEFNARYKLLIHMRVHSGEKPYPCDNENCNKSFSRFENLKIHVRSHTGEKPYKCNFDGCSKSFTNSSDRIKHHKTHKDPKPYFCPNEGCLKRYTDPSSLRKHLRAHKRTLAAPSQQQEQEQEQEQSLPGESWSGGGGGGEQPETTTCNADFDPISLLPDLDMYPSPLQQRQHGHFSHSWAGPMTRPSSSFRFGQEQPQSQQQPAVPALQQHHQLHQQQHHHHHHHQQQHHNHHHHQHHLQQHQQQHQQQYWRQPSHWDDYTSDWQQHHQQPVQLEAEMETMAGSMHQQHGALMQSLPPTGYRPASGGYRATPPGWRATGEDARAEQRQEHQEERYQEG